jgi:hypothetical protein
VAPDGSSRIRFQWSMFQETTRSDVAAGGRASTGATDESSVITTRLGQTSDRSIVTVYRIFESYAGTQGDSG